MNISLDGAFPRSALNPVPIIDFAALKNIKLEFLKIGKALNGEPIVDLTAYGLNARRYYSRKDMHNWPYGGQITNNNSILVRASVAEMLISVNKQLAGFGLELLILDGLRTLAEQKALWQYFERVVKSQNPNLTNIELTNITSTYCWDPVTFRPHDVSTWPVHMTGGSVDVSLCCHDSHELVFMGSVFDDPSEVSHTDYFEHKALKHSCSNIGLTSSETCALYYRRILFHAMEDAGFTNYAPEWWHFDYCTILFNKAAAMRGKKMSPIYGIPSIDV